MAQQIPIACKKLIIYINNTIYRRTSSISRIFKIADPYIGSVDPLTGEVTGLHVGQTMVHVTITQTMRAGNSVTYVDLCKREVPVQVRIVTSVEIVGVYGRTVLTGSAIRAIGILKLL